MKSSPNTRRSGPSTLFQRLARDDVQVLGGARYLAVPHLPAKGAGFRVAGDVKRFGDGRPLGRGVHVEDLHPEGRQDIHQDGGADVDHAIRDELRLLCLPQAVQIRGGEFARQVGRPDRGGMAIPVVAHVVGMDDQRAAGGERADDLADRALRIGHVFEDEPGMDRIEMVRRKGHQPAVVAMEAVAQLREAGVGDAQVLALARAFGVDAPGLQPVLLRGQQEPTRTAAEIQDPARGRYAEMCLVASLIELETLFTLREDPGLEIGEAHGAGSFDDRFEFGPRRTPVRWKISPKAGHADQAAV